MGGKRELLSVCWFSCLSVYLSVSVSVSVRAHCALDACSCVCIIPWMCVCAHARGRPLCICQASVDNAACSGTVRSKDISKMSAKRLVNTSIRKKKKEK